MNFDKIAGLRTIVAGISAFLYAVSFVILKDVGLSAFFLTTTGIASTFLFMALYEKSKRVSEPLALWALLMGTIGTLASAAHGVYDISNFIHKTTFTNLDLPSQVDPRGFATFALTGISIVAFCWLSQKGKTLATELIYLGYATGFLSLILFLGRLILLDPAHPAILYAALINGFVAAPLFAIILGLTLLGVVKK